MKVKLFNISIVSMLLFSCTPVSVEEDKINAIIAEMTLEEKAAQMLNLGLPSVLTGEYWDLRTSIEYDSVRFTEYIEKLNVGSIHNTVHPHYLSDKEEWHGILKTIQDASLNNTRMGIPVIYGIDNIHGANYVKNS